TMGCSIVRGHSRPTMYLTRPASWPALRASYTASLSRIQAKNPSFSATGSHRRCNFGGVHSLLLQLPGSVGPSLGPAELAAFVPSSSTACMGARPLLPLFVLT